MSLLLRAKSAARVEELGSELRGHQQGMEEMERRNARKYEALQQEYATLKVCINRTTIELLPFFKDRGKKHTQ